ncbi:MAG: hypothetical protein VB076_03595 [Synergistaceae bacterium]|nr:hypothetical protein [Synergistaceae bacterium]
MSVEPNGNILIKDNFKIIQPYFKIIKSINFLTATLAPFLISIEFDREFFSESTSEEKIYLSLVVEFSSKENKEPTLSIERIDNPEEVKKMKEYKEHKLKLSMYKLYFINFDNITPVYNKDPIYITKIWDNSLYLRTKITRPYEGATFREVTFSFYTSDIEGEENE